MHFVYRTALMGVDRNILPSSVAPPITPRQNAAPTYDAAYLSELKASTPTARPVLVDADVSYDADMSVDADSVPQSSVSSVIDLSGLSLTLIWLLQLALSSC